MDDEAATQQPAARPHRWIRAILAFGILLLVGAAVIWGQRLAIAEFALSKFAANAGVDPVDFMVTRLDFDGASIADITIGGEGGQRIASIDTAYTLGGLWRGTIDRATVSDAHLRGTVGPDGPVFAGIPLPTATDSEKQITIPVRVLKFETVRLYLKTPQGDIALTASGSLATPDGRTSDFSGKFTLESEIGNFEGNLSATRLPSGETFGLAKLLDGQVSAGSLRATGIRGAVQFLSLAERAFDVDANIEIVELRAMGETFSDTHLSIGARPLAGSNKAIALEVTLTGEPGTIDVAGNLTRSDTGDFAAAAAFAFDLARNGLRAEATGKSTVTLASAGQFAATIKFDRGTLAREGNQVSGIAGSARVDRQPNGEFQGDVSLTFQKFSALGLSGQPGTVSARLDNTAVNVDVNLAWEGGALSVAANGPRDGPIEYSTKGQLASVQALTHLADGFEAQGTASFSFDGSLRTPLAALRKIASDPLAIFRDLEMRGWFEGELEGLTVPNTVHDGAVTGRTEISKDPSGWQFATQELHLVFSALDSGFLHVLPKAAKRLLTGPIRINVHPHDGKFATVRITQLGNGHKVDANAAVQIKTKDIDIAVQGKLNA